MDDKYPLYPITRNAQTKARTRAGTPASPTPLDEQIGRTVSRIKGFINDPDQELRNIARQYFPSRNDSPEEQDRKLEELALGFTGSTSPLGREALTVAKKTLDKPRMGVWHGEGALPDWKAAQQARMAAEGKQKFLEPSVEKRMMYHGTKHNKPGWTNRPTGEGIREFDVGNRGMTFVSPESDFANIYGTDFKGDQFMSGAVYPVHVQARNPFDFQNADHLDIMTDELHKMSKKSPQIPFWAKEGPEFIRDRLRSGAWDAIEDPLTVKAAKNLGFDSMYMNEGGVKNLGVFDPKRIKSAIGNRGTYNINDPDITKAKGGIIHKAEGGSMDTPSLAQMRVQLNQRKNPDYIDSIGIEQAVDMNPKKYMTPNPSSNDFMPVGGVADGNGLPVGGIDQDNAQQGQQMMPQQLDQDQQPNPSPQGTPPPEQQGNQPPMGNMLSMTPQGQALQAMGQPPGMARGGKVDRRPFENSVQRNLRQLKNGTYDVSMTPEEKMKEQIRQRLLQEKAMKESMAKGGKVNPKQMAAIKAKMMMMKGNPKKYAEGGNVDAPYSETDKPGRILFHGKGHGETKGIIVPRHMWEGTEGVFEKGKKKGQTFKIDGMGEINKARAKVYGSENRDPLTIGQIGRVHKNVLDEHFAKPLKEQLAAENEALERLRAARHIGEDANTLDESEKLDTVKHERDAQGRSHVGYAAKGVAGHSLYTSGHGDNRQHHIINTCPGQTVGCGGGHDENGIIDTMKGTCFAPNAESQYVSAAIRRACHEQAKHDPKMTRDWILAHTGSLRKVSDAADKKNVRTLFRPNVVDETDTSSRHVIRHLNVQRKAKNKPDIISNQYGKTNELHDPENGYYVTHSNIGPKVKHGMSIAENVARDKQRVRSTITATEASGKDFTNEQGNKTPPKGSYFVTDVKRKSPMQKEMEKHIKHIKYWSTGKPLNELSKEEKAEEEEGHFDGNGNPTTEDKAHYGHMTFEGKRYDYQKQHVLHPRLVNVPERKENKETGKMETVEHMIPTDSRFMDEQFLPKKRFKTKNGKVAGHILMTTPTESTSNVGHETTFTHHVGEHNIDYAKRNKGEYEVDSPMQQAMAEGKEYVKPEPIKIVRKAKAVKMASGGRIDVKPQDYDDDFNCFPERNYIAQHHLANRAGVEDETELPASLLQRPKD